MTIVVTLMSFWGALIYAARFIIQERFLLNIPMLLVFAVVVFWVFILVSAQFKVVVNEFDTTLAYQEAVMFACIPAVCSSILTWCLCVEIPDLDLPLCFAAVYGGYLAFLCGSRKTALLVVGGAEKRVDIGPRI